MKKEVVPPDFVVCRTVFPLLSLALEKAGSRVFNNSETARICNDKRLTYSYVLSADIPSIETFIFDRRINGRASHDENEFPMIIKTAAGHGGEEVYLCRNMTDYREVLKSLPSYEYAEQPLISPCKGDVRVYVLENRIIAAVLRTSDDYRSNYSLGGRASVYTLSEEEKALVYKVISMIPTKMDFVGIDFLLTDEGMIFNEIEDVVGTRMLYDKTGLDPAQMYIQYIFEIIN